MTVWGQVDQGRLSVSSLRGILIWLEFRRGAFTCVSPCDRIWQVEIRSCMMDFLINSYTSPAP